MPGWRTTRSAENWAKLGIIVLLVILVRTLAEYYRLRHAYGMTPALFLFEPYLFALVILGVQCLGAVTLFFLEKYWSSAIVSAVTVVILLVYKIEVIGRLR